MSGGRDTDSEFWGNADYTLAGGRLVLSGASSDLTFERAAP